MAESPQSSSLRVIDLGRMGYRKAFEFQRRINRDVSEFRSPPTLLLVEHDPVITISHRRDVSSHLVASRQHLGELGIEVQPTDRGGDITYHGPGQLVAYPIVRLNELGLNLGRYMRSLEALVIDALAHFEIQGKSHECATGVWIEGHGQGLAKICAMGVRIRKNTTMHGLALNVRTELSHFQTIVPCGLKNSQVTSMSEQLGQATPSMDRVKDVLVDSLAKHLSPKGQKGSEIKVERSGTESVF